MSPFLSGGDRSQVVLPINTPNRGQDIEKNAFNTSTWPRQGDQMRGFLGVAPRTKPRQVQLNNKDVSYTKIRQQGRTMGTDFGEVIRVMPPTIQQDTFVDNKLGDALRQIKSKLGNDPFVEAYKAALNTFKTPDRRWKDYINEEIRKESIFNEGEGRVLRSP